MKAKRKNEIMDNWSDMNILYYDLWEVFKANEELTQQEIQLARVFLDFLNIDAEEDQFITFNSRPEDLMNMIVKFHRKWKSKF